MGTTYLQAPFLKGVYVFYKYCECRSHGVLTGRNTLNDRSLHRSLVVFIIRNVVWTGNVHKWQGTCSHVQVPEFEFQHCRNTHKTKNYLFMQLIFYLYQVSIKTVLEESFPREAGIFYLYSCICFILIRFWIAFLYFFFVFYSGNARVSVLLPVNFGTCKKYFLHCLNMYSLGLDINHLNFLKNIQEISLFHSTSIIGIIIFKFISLYTHTHGFKFSFLL